MDAIFDDPFGLGAPRQRFSEEETIERMLETGERMVADAGLRISFDLLRLKDVITEAGVSRSAVYKRWPRKEQYYADLLLRLAGTSHPASGAYDSGTPRAVIEAAEDHIDSFGSPEGRRRVFIEMCRRGAEQNFVALRERRDWQIYMTIHAAYLTLPEGGYKQTLETALRASEDGFREHMETFYRLMLLLLGYRIRPGVLDEDLKQFVILGAAAVEGAVLTSGVNDELTERRFLMDPFGVGRVQDWSHAAFLYTSLAVAVAEPDPDQEWTKERVAAVPGLIAAAKSQLLEDS